MKLQYYTVKVYNKRMRFSRKSMWDIGYYRSFRNRGIPTREVKLIISPIWKCAGHRMTISYSINKKEI